MIKSRKVVWGILWVLFPLLGIGKIFASPQQVEDSLRSLLQTLPPDSQRVNVLNDLAQHIYHEDYASALDYFNEAIQISKEKDFQPGLMNGFAGLSELENILGSYDKGLEHALAAFELAQVLGDSGSMARTMVTVGLIHSNLHSHKKALEALEKAKSYYGKGKRGVIIANHNIAVVREEMGDTISAKKTYFENLKKLEGTKYWYIFGATYNNLGRTFNAVTEGDSALYYFNLALESKRKVNNPNAIANTLMNIAEVLTKQKKFQEAEEKLQESWALVSENKTWDMRSQYHRLSGKLYKAQGRNDLAAMHFEALSDALDSIYKPQMSEQAARLEAAFQVERRQKEIELLDNGRKLEEAENNILKWITGASIVVLILSLIFLVGMVFRARERNRILQMLREKNEEVRRQQQEILLSNEALALQNARLEEVNREKDGLIGIVAHDIRAPLSRSAALIELLISEGDLNESQRRFADMIRKVSEDGSQLIQDLLEINAYESGKIRAELRPVRVDHLLESLLPGFTEAARLKQITLQHHPCAEDLWAKTDDRLLSRILDNLLSNAVKFTPKEKQVNVFAAKREGKVWICVQDEGPGLNESDQAMLFQKFMRLSARPTGGESSTGLGLSIVRSLADEIGAEVIVDSKLEKGSTFSVVLECLEEKQMSAV